jgi:outer membrane protein TolC
VDIVPFDLEHPYILDDFSGVQPDAQKLEAIIPDLIAQAIKYRYDIQAASIREREANVLLQGAYNAELPRVDLFGGVRKQDFRLGGGSERYFSSIEMDRPETDWTIGVNFSVPLYNDAAKGLLRQRQTQKYQATLRTRFLTQTSVSTLRSAISNQLSLIRQLKKANEVVALNQKLIEDEWKKLRAGFSTLFVLLDFESRLTDSLSERNRIYKLYMQNIANLRFLTGSLFESDACLSMIALEDITTLPGI